ncbi:cytochrome P450 [Nonomuraea sp. NPDC050404]|uniref:cytochrome P450 n=1 Tax=Nonomuraea sp. NPDC050404 TaxID=3155783 RepID=UPI003403E505
MTELYWDPFDETMALDPYPLWRRMRDERPVYRNDKLGFYALSRYADVEAAYRDPRTYSSAYGTVLEIMTAEPMSSGMMLFMDPPAHTTLRTLVSRAFTPRRIAQLEEYVRTLCAELLDPQVGGDGFDYVRDFAVQLPSRVISELIGVDPADREEVRGQIDRAFHVEEGKGIINEVSFDATLKLHAYFSEQVEARRRAPRDDMMTALVEAEVSTGEGTRRLTTSEAADFAGLLVSGGTETVARLLGWACVLLDGHPGQRAALAADASLLRNAVEEILRHESPAPVQGRTLTRDVRLHGTTIPAGAKVVLLTGAANRDERVYADPDRFDIRRRFDGHVAFGLGIHFCLGAALARLEGRVGLKETLRRFPVWEVDHQRAARLHSSTVRGYDRLPITL